MFGDVLGCLEHKPIYCITIYKQVSTCLKDDAIIPRGLAGLDFLVWADICSKDDARKTDYCIMLCWAWVGIADVFVDFGTFLDVSGRFATLCDILQHFVTFCNVSQHLGTFGDVWWLGHKPGK